MVNIIRYQAMSQIYRANSAKLSRTQKGSRYQSVFSFLFFVCLKECLVWTYPCRVVEVIRWKAQNCMDLLLESNNFSKFRYFKDTSTSDPTNGCTWYNGKENSRNSFPVLSIDVLSPFVSIAWLINGHPVIPIKQPGRWFSWLPSRPIYFSQKDIIGAVNNLRTPRFLWGSAGSFRWRQRSGANRPWASTAVIPSSNKSIQKHTKTYLRLFFCYWVFSIRVRKFPNIVIRS